MYDESELTVSKKIIDRETEIDECSINVLSGQVDRASHCFRNMVNASGKPGRSTKTQIKGRQR